MANPLGTPQKPPTDVSGASRPDANSDLAPVFVLLWVASVVRVAAGFFRHETFGTFGTLALLAVIMLPLLLTRDRFSAHAHESSTRNG